MLNIRRQHFLQKKTKQKKHWTVRSNFRKYFCNKNFLNKNMKQLYGK